jgi:hypothetical protein
MPLTITLAVTRYTRGEFPAWKTVETFRPITVGRYGCMHAFRPITVGPYGCMHVFTLIMVGRYGCMHACMDWMEANTE